MKGYSYTLGRLNIFAADAKGAEDSCNCKTKIVKTCVEKRGEKSK